MTHAPSKGKVCPWVPCLRKEPRTLGQQPVAHPKAPPLRADRRPRTGLVKDTHTEKLAPGATQKPWAWPRNGSKNNHTEGNPKNSVHPSTLWLRTRLLPSTRLHTLPLYLECPSFSCPSGELLCILQGPVQMFLPPKPFLIKCCSHITPFGVWPSLFLPLPQCFLTLAPSNMISF